jgi:hypothetical protein
VNDGAARDDHDGHEASIFIFLISQEICIYFYNFKV